MVEKEEEKLLAAPDPEANPAAETSAEAMVVGLMA